MDAEAKAVKSRRGQWVFWIVHICRALLALTFLFSGFVKANDPVGTSLKLREYAVAAGVGNPGNMTMLGLAIVLAFVEFTIGVALLFGLNRRLTASVTAVVMTVMTAVTVWVAAWNPVSDCGCFGDVLLLSNVETLLKNVVLLAAALVVLRWSRLQRRLVSESWSWLISLPAMVGIVVFAAYCVTHLPLIDFRPYRVGTDLRQARTDALRSMKFDVRIIYRRDGEELALEADADDPDSSWIYVETRRIPLTAAAAGGHTFLAHRGDVADFCVVDPLTDEDVTDDILAADGYTFLLVSPDLQTADQGCVGSVNLIYEYALAHGIGFYCLTASDEAAQQDWTDHTGAEYAFYHADGPTLQTMVRANPGLILLHDGRVVRKWSNWNMPEDVNIEHS